MKERLNTSSDHHRDGIGCLPKIHPRALIDNNEQQRDEMEIYQLVCEFNNSQRELRLLKQLVPASTQTLLLPTKPESEKMLLEKKYKKKLIGLFNL